MLDRFVEGAADRLGDELISVWLFGSRARSDNTDPLSDVDVLVVAPGGRHRDAGRLRRLASRLAEEEGLDPFLPQVVIWEPEWLANRREINSFFMQEVDRDKIVLHGSP